MSRLPDSYIAEKQVSGELLEQLTLFCQAAPQQIQALLDSLNPSANTLRDILTKADEIAARDGISRQQVVAKLETIFDQKIARKEKQRKVRQCLERLRYPQTQSIHDELEQCVTTLRQETGLRIQLPKNLEGDEIQLTISARQPDEFIRGGEQLQQLGTHPTTKRIFSLLCGE